jgi:putative transposase
MSNHIGSSTIYRTTLPNNAALARIRSIQLSREAKFRLRVIEHYQQITRNVSLTCRHFAVSRSYFYKWIKRYDPHRLASLENQSTRPKTVRPATYDLDFVAIIRKLRTDYPSYSAKKLAWVVLRDYGYGYSAATIGRIIQRFKLYFSKAIRLRQRHKLARKLAIARKPYNLKAKGPRKLIEFDMKHIWVPGSRTRYAFVAVDVVTKQAVIHVGGTATSQQAKVALEKTIATFGKDIIVVNDNGSENFAKAQAYLLDAGILQYFARPHTPKDKPHVENLIGKLQLECLDEERSALTVPELQSQINRWLNDYHFFRPHQALGYQTPAEYCDTLGLAIPRAEVSTM